MVVLDPPQDDKMVKRHFWVSGRIIEGSEDREVLICPSDEAVGPDTSFSLEWRNENIGSFGLTNIERR